MIFATLAARGYSLHKINSKSILTRTITTAVKTDHSFFKSPSAVTGISLLTFGLISISSGIILAKYRGLKQIDLEAELPSSISERALSKVHAAKLAWHEFKSHPLLSVTPYHLTQETLRGHHLIEAEYVGHLTKLLYLGSDLCGHNNIIHGGLIATVLQEACREFAGPASSAKQATYSINYVSPVLADQCVTIAAKAPVDSPLGRIVTADLLDKQGNLLANISAVFPLNN